MFAEAPTLIVLPAQEAMEFLGSIAAQSATEGHVQTTSATETADAAAALADAGAMQIPEIIRRIAADIGLAGITHTGCFVIPPSMAHSAHQGIMEDLMVS